MEALPAQLKDPLPPGEKPWPAQGFWTYDDYLRLPDEEGKRYEIIGGVLHLLEAPDFGHQLVLVHFASQLWSFVDERRLGIVLMAPFEVHFPGIAQPIQPDVLFIVSARLPKPTAKFYEGPPDLVAEVLSAGTLRRDRTVKFDAYERAGVREYWMLDPKTRSVEVYTLSGSEYALLGQWGVGESARSEVLAGFEVSVESLFAPTG